MKLLRVPAFAKLNLGLEVLGVREDGYHELRTIFQSVDLHDDVVVRSRRGGGLRLRCDHPAVPTDTSNLAARAALELSRWARREPDLELEIVKRIPVAGGLGGGSSDAAATLVALDRLWGLGLGPLGLHPLARRLGADVPYFLVGGTALGLGRGDEVYPLLRQLTAHVVIVDPGLPVKTAAVFRRIDARLTPRENGYTIFRFVSRDLEGQDGLKVLANDLEEAALEEVPELREPVARARTLMREGGARVALLSGSGSSLFGLFDRVAGARRAEAALEAAGFRAERARTLPHDEYRRLWTRSLGEGPSDGRRTR